MLKTVRLGYDGKGQVTLRPDTEAEEAWRRMGAPQGILESFVDFACEISVVLARAADGSLAAYPAVENRHVNHILHTTVAPAGIAPGSRRKPRRSPAISLSGSTSSACSRSRCSSPDRGRSVVNELAPRPHNSGHWTIDACVTSQFEQLVRAVCGLPLGSTERHADAMMTNLIGRDVENWRAALADPDAKLHLYGKGKVRPGRKMGHVTRLFPRGCAPR